VKPWVKFGISPFGVWRNSTDDPRGSNTKAGTTNYDQLYADVIKWQEKGWIDYLLPQLYWQIGNSSVDFQTLANWWKDHAYGRAIYVGQAVYKIEQNSTVKEWTLPDEMPRQIRLLRTIPEIDGSAFYSSVHFLRDLFGLQDSLKNDLYLKQAIVPPMSWIDATPPNPVVKIRNRGKKVKWKTTEITDEIDKPNLFIIYETEKGESFNSNDATQIVGILKGDEIEFEKRNRKKKKYEIRVSVLDRLNNEISASEPVTVKL